MLDDSGTLAITAWTCAKCGGVLEEVRIMTQGRKSHPRPIRYTEKPLDSIGRPAPVAERALRN
jgi:hypothetical protein